MKSNKAALVVSSFLLFFLTVFFFSLLLLSTFPSFHGAERITERETRECTRPLYDSSSLEDANCELGTRMLHLRENNVTLYRRGKERKERPGESRRASNVDDDFATIYS